MSTPRDFDILRHVSRSSGVPHRVPSTNTPEDLYLGEVSVNYGASNANLIASSVGLFLRVGTESNESVADQVVRVGPAYVTTDTVVATAPGITFSNNAAKLNQIGQLWLRKTDGAFFVNNGDSWFRVSPVDATQTKAGLVRLATLQEIRDGVSETTAVNPAGLANWAEESGFITRRTESNEIHVDQTIGDDSVENDGLDPSRPFLTLERALIASALRSYQAGANNDFYDQDTIYVHSGDYHVDNRPGVVSYSALPRLTATDTGPINPQLLSGLVTAINLTTGVLSVTNAWADGLYPRQQVFSSSGGSAIVVAVDNARITVRRMKGIWAVGDTVSYPNYSVFNPIKGGVIGPRGVSIVALDLRKTKFRPRYVGNFNDWLTDPECFGTGRTSIFKLTGGSYLYGFTFTDNAFNYSSHHLCGCAEFATADELTGLDSSYYPKVYQVLGLRRNPNVVLADFEASIPETEIVAPVTSNQALDATGFLAVDTTVSASPYVFNCSVRSRFGLNGLLVDGSKVSGLKSMVTAQFTNVSLQADTRAFVTDTTLPGNKRYKPEWRHRAFRAVNGGYIQIVSCFVICSAVHYEAEDGGELSITNSCSNFGDLSLVAKGFAATALPQDSGSFIKTIILPKAIDPTVFNIPILSYKLKTATNADINTASKLYVDAQPSEDRVAPFTYQPGELLYVTGIDGTEYTARLVDTAPFYSQDSNGWFFNTSTVNNGIYNNRTLVEGFPVLIKRNPDQRQSDDRILWLKLEGLNDSSKRQPVENFVLRLNQQLMGLQLNTPLFIADVKTTDFNGADLPVGTYYIALMLAGTANEPLSTLYPEININNPVANPTTSATYRAVDTLLSELGLSLSDRTALLQASTRTVDVPTTIRTNLHRPSIIRCAGHTWEWQGYLNYSSALPLFQDKVFTFQQSIARIKKESFGGRVYNTGMDQDGNFIIGQQVIDLKTGKQTDLTSNTTSDTKVFKRLTITEKLLLFPNATLDLRSARLAFNSLTDFETPILASSEWKLYSTTERAGFIQLATVAQAITGLDTKVALSPYTARELLAAQSSVVSATRVYLNARHPNASDLVSNKGTSSSNPFRTLERAALQANLISSLLGPVTIYVEPGVYAVKNQAGATSASAVNTLTAASKDLQFEIAAGSYDLFNPTGVDSNIYGGVVLGPQVHVYVRDPAGTVFSSLYVPTNQAFKSSILRYSAETLVERASFGTTSNFSHHAVLAAAPLSTAELALYSTKLLKVFTNLTSIQDWSEFPPTARPVFTNNTTYWANGAKYGYQTPGVLVSADPTPKLPTEFRDCRLRSETGLCGILADGSLMEGEAAVIIRNCHAQSTQVLSIALTDSTGSSVNAAYKTDYRHYFLHATNGAQIRAHDNLVEGFADEFWSSNGGTITGSGNRSQYGAISLKATGYAATAKLLQTKGKITALVPPRGVLRGLAKRADFTTTPGSGGGTATPYGENFTGSDPSVIAAYDAPLTGFATNQVVNISFNRINLAKTLGTVTGALGGTQTASNQNSNFKRLYLGTPIIESAVPEYIESPGTGYEKRWLVLDGLYLLGKAEGTAEKVWSSVYTYPSPKADYSAVPFYVSLRETSGDDTTGNNPKRQYYVWEPTGTTDPASGQPLGLIYLRVAKAATEGTSDWNDVANGRNLLYRLFVKAQSGSFELLERTMKDWDSSALVPDLFGAVYVQRRVDFRLGSTLEISQTASTNNLLWRLELTIPKTVAQAEPPERFTIIQTPISNTDTLETFWVYDVETFTEHQPGNQDGVYYLTVLLGSVAPPTGGVVGYKQNLNYLFPELDLDSPNWNPDASLSIYDTIAGVVTPSSSSITPLIFPGFGGAANTYDRMSQYSTTREAVERFVVAFGLLYSEQSVAPNLGTPYFPSDAADTNDLALAQLFNRYGKDLPPQQRKVYVSAAAVEFRQPSKVSLTAHFWDRIGRGSGNYSVATNETTTNVFSAQQLYNSRATEQNGGLVRVTGLDAAGNYHIGGNVYVVGTTSEITLAAPRLMFSAEGRLIDWFNTDSRVFNTPKQRPELLNAFRLENLVATGHLITANLIVAGGLVDFTEASEVLLKTARVLGTLQAEVVEADSGKLRHLEVLGVVFANKFVGSGVFEPGVRTVFWNATAPLGWVQEPINDYALRVVSGNGGETGGSVAFTTAFTNRTVPLVDHNHGITDPTHSHSFYSLRSDENVSGGGSTVQDGMIFGPTPFTGSGMQAPGGPYNVAGSGTGITINSASITQTTSNTMNFAVRYIDMILCTKT